MKLSDFLLGLICGLVCGLLLTYLSDWVHDLLLRLLHPNPVPAVQPAVEVLDANTTSPEIERMNAVTIEYVSGILIGLGMGRKRSITLATEACAVSPDLDSAVRHALDFARRSG